MGLGAWVMVNDNWGVTAAHTAQLVQEMYDAKGDSRIPNATVWLGANQMRLGQTYYLDQAADIAVFEIENLPERWTERARFRTGPMKPGASILRMGFPFHNLEVAFDNESGEFKFNTGTPAMFPTEGITTRLLILDVKPTPPPYPVHLVETSSPGIKHQSGGPILDVEGTVWAIQTKTRLLDLGISGQVIDSSGSEIAVPQYLNSGFGADAETVMGFLDHHGISYQTD